MDVLLQFARFVLPVFYLAVAVGYGLLFFADHKLAARWAPLAFRVTLLVHLVALALLTIRWSQFPAATVSQILSATAFALAVVYAFVEWRGRVPSTGFLMLSLAAALQILSALTAGDEPPYREIFHNPLFSTHVAFGLLAYSAFAVAAVYAFLFLGLYREIKRHRFSLFFGKLPPLEVLERMVRGAVLVGVASMTVNLASGFVWANQIFEDNWLRDPKIIISLLTWAFYLLTLLLHRQHRIQARQLASASIAGFSALLFSLLAVNHFLTDLHGFF